MAAEDQLPIFHVVGFTGHRQLENQARVEHALLEVLAGLRSEQGVEWLALSSIAVGSDMVFARTALRLGLGWEAVLPMPPVEFRHDFADEEWRGVETLLAEAEQVRVIGERSQRDDSYLDCGMETVNHCDLLLAVWDGAPARGRGGTAEIVAYAREMGRPIIIIDSETLKVRRENFEQLKTGDRHLEFFNQLAPAPAGATDTMPGRTRVYEFQRKLDHIATQHGPNFRRLTAITVWLHVLATTLAAATVAFGLHLAVLPWAKFLCLVAALGVAVVIRNHRDQTDWVRCRLGAEIARSALATWGLPRALRLFDDFDWAGLEPLRRSLDILQRRATRMSTASFDLFKQRYVGERINGQLTYFARQESRAVPQLARLRLGFFISTTAALSCTALYALTTLMPEHAHPDWMQAWFFDFAPIVLPVLAASFLSLISINDLHRRVARFKEMRIRLEAARKEAVFVQTWGSLERVVAKTERALLQEVFEWNSITSFSESH
ncbi:MAG: hypothetical protein EXS43_05900 [Opitutus sp.]|nr:hypothetical protein [Opitutus sp.]